MLRLLWGSGFRLGDVLNLSWDDERKIHPRWPNKRRKHATIVIPSTQKNKKAEAIYSMLDGNCKKSGLVGGLEEAPQLSPEEIEKLNTY